eukprot:7573695-Ditylum_brightwellii.AAC.1
MRIIARIRSICHQSQGHNLRQIKSVSLIEYELNQECRLGMDAHTDTMCVVKHAKVLEIIEGETCSMYSFSNKYEPMKQISI